MPQLGAVIVSKIVSAAAAKTLLWKAIAVVIDTVILVGVSSVMKPKIKKGAAEPVAALLGRKINARGPTGNRQAAYGECPIGGQVVFMDVTGQDGAYLNIVLAHASHEVKGLGDIYINEERVQLSAFTSEGAVRKTLSASNKFYDFLEVYDHLGAPDQTHDTLLASRSSQWSSDNTMKGIAYSVVRLKIDREDNVFGGGVPAISRQVQGKRVRDARTNPITGATATNPVVITSATHGMVTGDRAEHSGVGGMVELNLEANQLNSITYIDANSYSIDSLDGTLFTAYTSGGALNKTTYTDNAALCVADYITSELGFGQTGLTYDQVDEAALIAAADVCDEQVTKATSPWATATVVRGDELRTFGTSPIYQYRSDNIGGTTGATAPTHTSGTVSDGSVDWTFVRTFSETISRYTINGTVSAGEAPSAVLRKLKTAMAGFVEYIGDTWVINAGAYIDPTVTLSESDMRGVINGTTQASRLDGANRVRGTYANEDDNYKIVEYPAATNSTYLTEDAEEIAWRDVNLEFTTTSAGAQRLAKIALERARQQITHTALFSMKAMQVQAGDNFNLKFEKYGYGSTGSHDGSADASVLTDTTAAWTVNGLTGLWIQNTTDGSAGEIVSNTATTITVTLTGGTENDWDISDAYTISKTFVCLSHKLVTDGGALVVEMSFQETASSVYDWSGGEETHQDPARNSILPDAFIVADPTNLVATSGTAQLITKGDSILSRIRVGFTPSNDATALVHELAWRKRKTFSISSITQDSSAVFTTTATHNYIVGDIVTNWDVGGMTSIIGIPYTITAVTDTTYTIGALDSTSLNAHTSSTGFVDLEWEGNAIIAAPSTSFYISDVEDSVDYDIQVRATSAINKSAWVAIQHEVQGKTEAPATPTVVATAGIESVVLVLAQGSAEADFKKFQIWQHTADVFQAGTATYETTDTSTTITGLTASTALYFWAKAVDTTGNTSAVSASDTATPNAIAAPVVADGSITTAKLANDAVTNDKIGDDAVDTPQIANDAVENAQIGPLAVDTAEIAVDAITNAKIGDSAVDTLQIANDAVENAQIGPLAVDTTEIAVDAIENAQIAPLAVGTTEIATDAVTNAKIGANAVDTTEIAADAIENAQIAPLAVTDAEINDVAPETLTAGTFANKVLVIDGPTAGAAGGIIKSQGFVSGTSGWQIESDGTAEFNDVTVRGDLEGGSSITIGTGFEQFKVTSAGLTSFGGRITFDKYGTLGAKAVFSGTSVASDYDISIFSYSSSETPAKIVLGGTGAYVNGAGYAVLDGLTVTTGANLATASGYVGIGTASPSSGLHVSKATTAGHYVAQFKQNTTSQPFGVSIGEASGSTAGYPMFDILNSSGSTFFRVDTGTGNVGIGANPDGGSNKLLVTGAMSATGNVGIGTTSPSARLHVESLTSSGAYINYDGQSNGEYGLRIESNSNGGNFEGDFSGDGSLLDLFANSAATSGGDIIACRTQSATPVFLVKGNGRVGINDSAPSYTLDVNGDTGVSGDLFISAGTASTTAVRFGNPISSLCPELRMTRQGGSTTTNDFIKLDTSAGEVFSVNAAGGIDAKSLIVGGIATNTSIAAANDLGSFSVRGDATYPATMSFHRSGVYAVNFGLSTSNLMELGGWSAGSIRHTWNPGNGDYTATGTVTASSLTATGTVTGNSFTIGGVVRLPATLPVVSDVEADNGTTYAGSGDPDIVDMVDANATAINAILSYLNL